MKRTLLFAVCLLFNVFIYAQSQKNSYLEKTKLTPVSFPGIKGKIFDIKTGVQLPARVVITDAKDSVYDSYYKALPGFFTEEDGTFQDSLKPGNYTLTVFQYRSRISKNPFYNK